MCVEWTGFQTCALPITGPKGMRSGFPFHGHHGWQTLLLGHRCHHRHHLEDWVPQGCGFSHRSSDHHGLDGNHTYSHKSTFPLFSKKRMINDIKRCDEIITNITNEKVEYFRPPFGVTNPLLKGALKHFSYKIIGRLLSMWSIWMIIHLSSPKTLALALFQKLQQ